MTHAIKPKPVLAAALVVLAAAACSTTTSPKSPAGALALPAPTGDHPVGTTPLYL
jgi:hypothetical protein